jgi:small-conductance mechanosensitive channel
MIFSNIFWIRDGQPVNWEMFTRLERELFAEDNPQSLANHIRTEWLPTFNQAHLKTLSPIDWTLVAILWGLIPILLIRYQLRMRRFTMERNLARLEAHKRNAWGWDYFMATAGRLLLIPGYIYLLSLMTSGVAQTMLFHFALFLGGWFLNNTLFGMNALAEAKFYLPREVTANLCRGFRIVLAASLLFLPWRHFQYPPFNHQATPLVSQLLFGMGIIVTIHLLFRRGSPLVRHLFAKRWDRADEEGERPHFMIRNWGGFSTLLTLIMLTLLGLNAAGYQFGVEQITRNGLLTLGTILLLFSLRHLLLSLALRFRPTGIVGLARFLTLPLLFLGGLALATYWGVNTKALDLLNQVTIYSVTSADGKLQLVTLANLFHSIIILFIGIWLLRNLGTLYEFGLFPNVGWDVGLRYAFQTMSQYAIFAGMLVWSLSALQMDVRDLGWLVAAMSVGLGFGLREIFANFVSGVILLIERPIRVGDFIDVGTIIRARVVRINIRSTTVINPDAQEILVPNSNLIINEVTNWTLANEYIRIKIPIGIAYGSDIEKARAIIMEIALAQAPNILIQEKGPPSPEVLFMSYLDSALLLELRVLVINPVLRNRVRDRINTQVYFAFKKHGIEFPFPQSDIHIKGIPEIPGWPRPTADDHVPVANG